MQKGFRFGVEKEIILIIITLSGLFSRPFIEIRSVSLCPARKYSNPKQKVSLLKCVTKLIIEDF